MSSFFGELNRRSVFKVGVAYTIVAWLLVQIIVAVEEPLNLPGWFDTFIIVSLIIGFPIALVLAWAFHITPETPHGKGTEKSGLETGAAEADEGSAVARQGNGTAERPSDFKVLRHSVAVLPLENLSPNPDDAYFAAGIHEEILNYLTKIKDLSVIARTSVKKYADSKKSVAEIAAELKVTSVMEGSVRYAGDSVRVTMQLIDAATEGHLWSEVYERKLTDIFAIQVDIATQVAQALQAKLSVAERLSVDTHPTASSEAYAYFLKAMAIFAEGDGATAVTTPPSVRERIQSSLDSAIDLDPEFALPYGVKSLLYAISPLYDPIKEQEWVGKCTEFNELVRRNAEKALSLNSSLGFPHLALAMNHQFNWRGKQAEEAYERALELRPNDPNVLTWSCSLKWVTEQYDHAIRLAQRAVALDPANSWAQLFLGLCFNSAGNHQASVDVLEYASVVVPGSALPHLHVGIPLVALGRDTQALEGVRLAAQLLPDESAPAIHIHLAYGFGRLGQREEARRILNKVKGTIGDRHVDPIVWVYADLAVGDAASALESFSKAVAKREYRQEPFARNLIKENAWSDPILQEPQFVELRGKLGFVE
jgi:TolB-like protein/tetratricopeptide (TPR) repeat protein